MPSRKAKSGAAAVEPSSKLVKLSETQSRRLANRLHDWVDSAEAEKQDLLVQWKVLRSYYNNEPLPFVSNFLKNCQDIAFPFIQSKIDTLNDNVTQAIFNQDPICAVSQPGPREVTLALERIVQFFFERGQLEEVCRSGQEDVAIANEGIIRLVLKPEEMIFGFEPVTPDDFVILGSACYDLKTADMAGHAFFPTMQEVLDRISHGEYYDVGPGYKPEVHDWEAVENKTRKVNPSSTIDELQRPVRIYFLSFVCDLEELELAPGVRHKPNRKWYTAHYDYDSNVLLQVMPSSMKRHPYFNLSYLPRPTRGHWSSRSVASNLAGLHVAYQVCNNMMVFGHLMSAFRPVVSKGPFAKGQTVGPGAMINTMGSEVTIPAIDFDPKQLPWEIEKIEQAGDASIRISQAGQAMAASSKKTATQVMEEAQGQSVGRTGYVGVYSIPICEMAREILLFVEALWPEFKAAHGPALPDAPEGTPDGAFPFGDVSAIDLEITGASPASNPAFQFARGTMLLSMLKEVPELKRPEVVTTIVGGLQLRNASELVKTQEEMKQEQDAAFQQQMMLAQMQQPAALGAGTPPPALGAGAPAGNAPPVDDAALQGAFLEGLTGGGGEELMGGDTTAV